MMGSAEQQNSTILLNKIPGKSNGWVATEPDDVYNSETLYSYIDGAAELYRAFDVKRVISRRYTRNDKPEIILDIFEMGSPEDAFGVYHHSIREGNDIGIGNESEFLGSHLTFWKGVYILTLLGIEETDEVKDVITQLARHAADSIPDKGHKPALLELLPDDTKPIAVHFFRNHHCLNSYYFIADDNLLNLSDNTEGVLARYETTPTAAKDKKIGAFIVIIIRYETREKAHAARMNFIKGYIPELSTGETRQLENSGWAGIKEAGDSVIIVLDSPSREIAISSLNSIYMKYINSNMQRGGKPQ